MADIKISALTAASTPLAGTEVLPIVQSSTTKKVAVSDLTAGRNVNAGSITTTGTPTGSLGASKWLTQFETTAIARSYICGPDASTNATWEIYRSTMTTPTLGWTFNSNGDYTINNGNLVQGTAAKGINFTANTPAAGMTSQLLNWYEEGTWTPTVSGTNLTLSSINSAYYTIIGRQVTVYCYINVNNSGANSTALVIGGLPKTCVGYAPATRFYGPNKFTGDCYVAAGTATIIDTNILGNGSSAIMVSATYFF